MNDNWTQEETEDYEQWERDFEKPSGDLKRDEWLAWAEIEFQWGMEVPSC